MRAGDGGKWKWPKWPKTSLLVITRKSSDALSNNFDPFSGRPFASQHPFILSPTIKTVARRSLLYSRPSKPKSICNINYCHCWRVWQCKTAKMKMEWRILWKTIEETKLLKREFRWIALFPSIFSVCSHYLSSIF